MRALITHVYSADNKGDAALLSVLISDLRASFPGIDLDILTLDDVQPGELFDDVPVHNSFMHYVIHPRLSAFTKALSALGLFAWTVIWASGRRMRISLPWPRRFREAADLYRRADLVVAVGGGYLRGKPGLTSTVELALMAQPFAVSRAHGTPTVLYTQSVGPFHGPVQRWLIRAVARRVDLMLLREDTSVALVEQLGIETPTARTIDSGFAFVSRERFDVRGELGWDGETWVLGVTVREWLDPDRQTRYESAVAQACDHVVRSYAAKVLFIPQVTSVRNADDDRVPSRRVWQAMQCQTDAVVFEADLDHHRIKALYNEMNLILGTRFHSVIFALTSHVPAVAIEYEHKTSGIMADLGLSRWVHPIETVTAADLIASLDAAIDQAETTTAYLRDVVPSYAADTQTAALKLRALVGGP